MNEFSTSNLIISLHHLLDILGDRYRNDERFCSLWLSVTKRLTKLEFYLRRVDKNFHFEDLSDHLPF